MSVVQQTIAWIKVTILIAISCKFVTFIEPGIAIVTSETQVETI
jgi:hypothetical protein